MEKAKLKIKIRNISLNHWRAAFAESGLDYRDFAKQRGISFLSARDKFSGGSNMTLLDVQYAQAMTKKEFDYFFEE